jgi:hypothetical protein
MASLSEPAAELLVLVGGGECVRLRRARVQQRRKHRQRKDYDGPYEDAPPCPRRLSIVRGPHGAHPFPVEPPLRRTGRPSEGGALAPPCCGGRPHHWLHAPL